MSSLKTGNMDVVGLSVDFHAGSSKYVCLAFHAIERPEKRVCFESTIKGVPWTVSYLHIATLKFAFLKALFLLAKS